MAWTNPQTWVDGQVVAASDLNGQIRDNLSYLMAPNVVLRSTATGTLSTTSTIYASLGTAWALTLNSHGGHVLVGAQAAISAQVGAGDRFYMAVDVDGTPYPMYVLAANFVHTLNIQRLFTGLASGAHTVGLKWRVSVNTAQVVPHEIPLELWAVEI